MLLDCFNLVLELCYVIFGFFGFTGWSACLDNFVAVRHRPCVCHAVELKVGLVFGCKLAALNLFELVGNEKNAEFALFVECQGLEVFAVFVLLEQSYLLLDVGLCEQIFVALLSQAQPAPILNLLQLCLHVDKSLLVNKHCWIGSIGQAVGDDL